MSTPPWYAAIPTPAYVADLSALRENLERIAHIKDKTGCTVLLATKAFARVDLFPLMAEVLDGTTASGLYEARLGHETFGKQVHVYAPAFRTQDMGEILRYVDHIYFNSPAQMNQFRPQIGADKHIGLRVNPGYSLSTVGGDLYNPCAPHSRFGTPADQLGDVDWNAVDIFHVHALCEAGHEGSLGLIQHVSQTFAPQLKSVKAVNFGGGHLVNHPAYDRHALIDGINRFQDHHGVSVILEPGGGIVHNAGYLVATVLDIHHNGMPIAILDASASCHHPDVIEAGYRAPVIGAGQAGEHPHDYILAGNTCMTGDLFGTYSFPDPLKKGDKILFADALHYTFVKSTVFNGTPLPDFGTLHENGVYEVVKDFDYGAFRGRL
ncbi:MAG: carboxynorspermidine decarboxylase [Alphaproteobacteria bacterium]